MSISANQSPNLSHPSLPNSPFVSISLCYTKSYTIKSLRMKEQIEFVEK